MGNHHFDLHLLAVVRVRVASRDTQLNGPVADTPFTRGMAIGQKVYDSVVLF